MKSSRMSSPEETATTESPESLKQKKLLVELCAEAREELIRAEQNVVNWKYNSKAQKDRTLLVSGLTAKNWTAAKRLQIAALEGQLAGMQKMLLTMMTAEEIQKELDKAVDGLYSSGTSAEFQAITQQVRNAGFDTLGFEEFPKKVEDSSELFRRAR